MQGYGHAGSAGIMTSNNHPGDLLLWDAMHNSCFFLCTAMAKTCMTDATCKLSSSGPGAL